MSIIRLTFFAALALLGVIFGVYSGIYSFSKIEYKRIEINKASIIVEVAADAEARRVGLVAKKNMAPNYGMLFVFDQPSYHGLWMKGMQFPVDILWIRNNHVVDLEENVLPATTSGADGDLPVYRPDALANMVLEASAGFARHNKIKIGDEVKMSPFSLQGGLVFDKISAPSISYLNNTLSSQPLPGSEFFIETLQEKSAKGGNFKIEQELERNKIYQKFIISYKSGDFKINGTMSVPLGKPPVQGYPILILNSDFSDSGSEKIQDFFARHGYVTIQPDYPKRDSSGSAQVSSSEYDFYVGYTQDVIDLLDTLKKLPSDLDTKLNIEKIGVWGQGVGGVIAMRLMVLRPEVKAYVLFDSLSAEAEDNFYTLSEKERTRLKEIYGAESKEIYRKISPLTYFADVSSPVQLHHGVLGKDVPLDFSEKIFAELGKNDKKVEFFKYPSKEREFGNGWQLAVDRSLDFFNHYVAEIK